MPVVGQSREVNSAHRQTSTQCQRPLRSPPPAAHTGRLTAAVAVLLHSPHGALVEAPGQLLPNHLQLPKAPVREVCPTQLEDRGQQGVRGQRRPCPAEWAGAPRQLTRSAASVGASCQGSALRSQKGHSAFSGNVALILSRRPSQVFVHRLCEPRAWTGRAEQQRP